MTFTTVEAGFRLTLPVSLRNMGGMGEVCLVVLPAVLLVTDPVRVASATKSMVAVSVPKLVEEGVIQLQDPAGKHLPEFDTLMKPPGPVTVDHLLRHTSGLLSQFKWRFSVSCLSKAGRRKFTYLLSL
ncbi:serine hydrolase [Pseudarthrobacter sp. Y6]|uniref:serine hydrolase n=1 Tax=Pseudarthrobacter sp. Y6 TaxID=3418422 RepID=UPI003CEFE0CE